MKVSTTFLAISCAGLLAGGTWACSSQTVEGCVCGTTFRQAIVIVVNTQGEPVTGVGITVTRVNTEESLEFLQSGLAPGTYIILDDTFTPLLAEAGEVIQVQGTKGTASFTQDYVFGTDSCRCHIQRISGPDSVVMDVVAGSPVAKTSSITFTTPDARMGGGPKSVARARKSSRPQSREVDPEA